MKTDCPLLYEREFDINNWVEEYDSLFEDFKIEYIDAHLSFYNVPIQFKRNPKVNGRFNSFYHITTGHDKPISTDEERIPDLQRIRKFYYPKILIENYNCKKGCEDCSGILHWFEKNDKNIKAFIYFIDQKYIVILEYRKTETAEYFLFKTAYYVEYKRQRNLFLSNYEKNKDFNPFVK